MTSSNNLTDQIVPWGIDGAGSESQNGEIWITTKVSVVIGLVELSLHYGIARDASLATLQVYKLSFIMSLFF